jgi:hypothetical protein
MTRSNNKNKSKKQKKNTENIDYKKTESIDYKKDDIVSYINSDGTKSQVKIIGVHYDTPPDTYYTIEFSDGKHKQTIRERLTILF